MLTKLIVRNFKRFDEVEAELGNPVVFVGPNNSGKTSALQALALWGIGVRRWAEKRKGKTVPEKRPGVTINRRDLVAIPVPEANLLWRDLHVRDVQRIEGKQDTKNVRIDITVEGVTGDVAWRCGLEFDYANAESFYCRPLRLSSGKQPERMGMPPQAENVQVAFLPPMSGLAANETRLDPGAVSVRVGEGRTAEVLRNLCHRIASEDEEKWRRLCEQVDTFFAAKLLPPEYVVERGEILMQYEERGVRLDLSSSGRGLQQTLLLLAYMYANPGAVLLLDEPDAHLEILRQRQIYQMLSDVARDNGNQIIVASHSEVILNEAAGRDVVVAFVGKPHRVDRGSQVSKALGEIGFEDYNLAEQTGWVLYLEGSSDLAMLRQLARKMEHTDALAALERPFVCYVGSNPGAVRRHYWGLREAVSTLRAVALFDRLPQSLPENLGATGLMWKRREIENYVCLPETLRAYAMSTAEHDGPGPVFAPTESAKRQRAMEEAIKEVEKALKTLDKGSPWSEDTKVSDDFLTPLFQAYFKRLGLPNVMAKKNFHELGAFVPADRIDAEVGEKLDAIAEVAASAKPMN